MITGENFKFHLVIFVLFLFVFYIFYKKHNFKRTSDKAYAKKISLLELLSKVNAASKP